MARVLKGSRSFNCTPTRSSANRMSHTCLCLPSYIVGTHLPTPERWKAEFAWEPGYVVRQFISPKAVTEYTNRAVSNSRHTNFNHDISSNLNNDAFIIQNHRAIINTTCFYKGIFERFMPRSHSNWTPEEQRITCTSKVRSTRRSSKKFSS